MYINSNNKDSIDDICKIPYEVFLMVGNSLLQESINQSEIKLDYNINENLEYEIIELEKQKTQILEQIEILSLSNKKLSDKIKENEVNLTKLNKNKFSFFSYSNKQNLYKVITDDQKAYDKTFETLSELYEELIQLTNKINGLSNYFIYF